MQKATLFQSLCAVLVRGWFAKADIIINGTRAWDIRVNDPVFYTRVLFGGSLGFGEAYQASEWDTDDLAECVSRAKKAKNEGALVRLIEIPFNMGRRVLKFQTRLRAKKAVEEHYDLDIKLYEAMLKETMLYSCAYFERGADGLTPGQRDKMWLLGEKLRLKPGMTVLDVGGGFGSLAFHFAEQHGVHVTSITLSRDQYDYARKHYSNPKRGSVEFRLQDYRDVTETFDRIVSVGMFEHVGPPFYQTFMDCMYEYLKPGGIFVLHTIVGHGRADRWVNKYIFPYGVLPALQQIVVAVTKARFFEWDRHEFGKNYARTIRYWRENFIAAWPRFVGKPNRRGVYDKKFYRTWIFYLAASEGYFEGGHGYLYQFVFAKHPKPADYVPVR